MFAQETFDSTDYDVLAIEIRFFTEAMGHSLWSYHNGILLYAGHVCLSSLKINKSSLTMSQNSIASLQWNVAFEISS